MKKLTKCDKCSFGYFSDKEHRCKIIKKVIPYPIFAYKHFCRICEKLVFRTTNTTRAICRPCNKKLCNEKMRAKYLQKRKGGV